jgi:hypothetical protein
MSHPIPEFVHSDSQRTKSSRAVIRVAAVGEQFYLIDKRRTANPLLDRIRVTSHQSPVPSNVDPTIPTAIR